MVDLPSEDHLRIELQLMMEEEDCTPEPFLERARQLRALAAADDIPIEARQLLIDYAARHESVANGPPDAPTEAELDAELNQMIRTRESPERLRARAREITAQTLSGTMTGAEIRLCLHYAQRFSDAADRFAVTD
jgi:hypothetical protein